MKQVLVKKGIVYGEDVPTPVVSDGSILIKVVLFILKIINFLPLSLI